MGIQSLYPGTQKQHDRICSTSSIPDLLWDLEIDQANQIRNDTILYLSSH